MDKSKYFNPKDHQRNVRNRVFKDRIFHFILALSILFSVSMLILLIQSIVVKGIGYLDWQFITSMPSRFPQKAGLFSALIGSIYVIVLTILFAFPIGVGTAIYLVEYSDKETLFNRVLQLNISNLAGVPSIVYGMLGLTVFVRFMAFERSLLSGALTLALLILPVIIVSSQEALKAVPNSIKEASYALGATKWQTIKGVILPYSLPGILTGTILALSRAMGEAAPLIMVGAAGYVSFLPKSVFDSFTVLPIQIFNWTSRPQEEFALLASAGIMVLMTLLLLMNGIAIYLRNKYQQRME
jgi:phosphate transport system permease protein